MRYSKKQAKRYLSPQARRGKRLKPPSPYRSWLEADVAQDLKKRKVKFSYETERIAFVEPAKTRTYKPDLILADGNLIVEVKGRWTAHDRQKMAYVIEQNPDRDIRLLFHKDNTISKNSRTRYSGWCKKRGFKYAIGTSVPEEWIEEYTSGKEKTRKEIEDET